MSWIRDRVCLRVALLAALAWPPGRSVAQTPASAQPDQTQAAGQPQAAVQTQAVQTQPNQTQAGPLPTLEAEPLSETRVQTRLAPPAAPASAASQAPGQTVSGQTAAAPATGPPSSQKQQRKAEKLYIQGAKLLDGNDTGGAYGAFAQAAALDPSNQRYVAAREIARQHWLTALVQEAEKARLTGHPEVARQKLVEALALDPKNPIVTQHINELADDRTIDDRMFINASGKGADDAGIDAEGPIELSPADVKKSFHLKGTEQEILRQVLTAYQIAPTMDSSVEQKPTRLDADDVDYAEAARMARMLTGTFFVPLDPKRVLVAKDTKENRQKYERLLVESIYLPGLTATEMTDIGNLAKNVFDAPVATPQSTQGMLTVRAPEGRMKALNATLGELLDGRAQVMVEAKLYDINTVRTTNVGVLLPSQTTVFNVDTEINSLLQGNQAAIDQIIASGLAAPGDYGAILAILIATGQITSSLLTEGFATFGGGITQFGAVPGSVTANLAMNNSDTRTLDDIQLRVQDGEAGTFRVGTRYPIVTSTYSSGGSSLSTAGINSAGVSSALNGLGVNLSSLTSQVTIPQIQYQDLGLTLKATPVVQHGAEVQLKMELEFTALGGSTLDGNPILNNRKYTGTITLRDGGSALVVSSLSKQETKAVTGIPWLSELPGLRSTTNDDKNVNTSSLVVLITPHIVRRTHTEVAGREIVFAVHE